MRIAVPDVISNSYFPAVAAIELGAFKERDRRFARADVSRGQRLRRRARNRFVAGSAHSALAAFPEWQGVRLLAAQAQGMYWFLVLRTDSRRRGTIRP